MQENPLIEATTPPVKEFRFSETGWKRYRLRFLRRVALVSLIPVGVGSFLFFNGGSPSGGTFIPILAIGVVLVTLVASAFFNLRRERAVWNSALVRLGADFVSRQQLGLPENRIGRAEITKIQLMGLGLLVHTANKYHSVAIPIELDSDDFAEIQAAISKWQPVEQAQRSFQVRNTGMMLVLLAAFAILLFSFSPGLVTFAALVLIGVYAYTLIQLRRSEGVDPQFRRRFYWLLGFVVFIASIKLCAVWGGLSLLGG